MSRNVGTDRGGRPRDERLDSAIVAATIQLLEERGYKELSLAAVAVRAGTSTPAIYRRWSSKAELVAHAVFRTDGDDVVADTGDVAADLATMIRWAAQKIGRSVALTAITGLLSESREHRSPAVGASERAARLVEARLARAQQAGQLRNDVDPRVLASLIAGPVFYMLLTGTSSAIDDRWISGLVDVVLDGGRVAPKSGSAE